MVVFLLICKYGDISLPEIPNILTLKNQLIIKNNELNGRTFM